MYLPNRLCQTPLPIQAPLVTARGMPIGIDIHLRTAGWLMQWSAVHHPSLATYVSFTSLLIPMDTPPLVPGKQQQRGESSHSKCSITDQQTWLEAWNQYASARIAYDPDVVLSLVKYQTLTWQMVSKTPQMSSAKLKHPYNTLNSSASMWDILTKHGFPSC